MKLGVIMKRFYTNRDLIEDRYGRMFHLPRTLVERGWDVRVFCPDFRKREAFVREIDGVAFQSIPARFAGAWTSEAPWTRFKPEIWLSSGQLIAADQVERIARRQGAPWVIDFYDYYPAFYPRLVRSLADRWSHRLIRRASGVVVASKALAEWAARSSGNVARLPNGIDRSVFYARERLEARKSFRLDPAMIWVGYFGSLNPEHGLLDVLGAIELLRSQGQAVGLVCAGSSNRVDMIESSGARWLGMLPQTKLAEVICACDCALAPYPESDQINYSNSCRLTEYMACSVPVVATRVGDHAQLLPESHPGWAQPGNPESIASAIERQIKDPVVTPLPSALEWSNLGTSLDQFLAKIVADHIDGR